MGETLRQKRDRIISERPFVDSALLDQLGINRDVFNKNFMRLCEKWWDFWGPSTQVDTAGRRLVTSTFASHLNEPVVLAMISDDVECFKKHYIEEKGDIFCLEFSCIAGAEKIVTDFYIGNPVKEKCLFLSDNAVAYALSSGKQEFASSVANASIALGRRNPGPLVLYSFGNSVATKRVRELFSGFENSRPLP